MPRRTRIAPIKRRESSFVRRVMHEGCYFCRQKVAFIDYKDVALLRKFMSDRSKIRGRRITGSCGRHQREMAVAIKNARELALLPYGGRQA